MADTWPHLLRVELAAVARLCAYGALAAAIGTLFSRHPFVAVLVYFMLIEAGLGSAPIVLNLITVRWHLRNLAELPLPDDGVHGAYGAVVGLGARSPSLVDAGLICVWRRLASTAPEYRTDR